MMVVCSPSTVMETKRRRIVFSGKMSSSDRMRHIRDEFLPTLPESDEYRILSNEYFTTKEKYKFAHTTGNDSHEFEMTLDRFIHGNRCPQCARQNVAKKQRSSWEEVLKRIRMVLPEAEYLVSGGDEYRNVQQRINVTHLTCGETYNVMIRHILYDKNGCPVCFNSHRNKKF